jgi:hypothetical protein
MEESYSPYFEGLGWTTQSKGRFLPGYAAAGSTETA